MKFERGLTVERMVELSGVSRAGFYRFNNNRAAGPDPDMDLRDAIQRIALEWPCYGRPRITAELRRQGWTVNHKRVRRGVAPAFDHPLGLRDVVGKECLTVIGNVPERDERS